MNDPESYVKYHRLQYRDSMRCLTQNIGRFKWKGVDSVQDTTDLDNGQRTLDKNVPGTPNTGKCQSKDMSEEENDLDTSLQNRAGKAQFEIARSNTLGISINQSKARAIRVLDVGSGDGSFTSDELRKALPCHYQITGCDRSPAMVDHANAHHAGNGVQFELTEIGKPLPDHFIGAFDHIFSFFCYHWIPNQKVAFSQTYDMLTPGGDCLLLMVAYCPIVFEMYRWFSKTSRWSEWINNLDDFISPYHDCEDPAEKLRKYAEEAGFKDIYVENMRSTYTYASEQDVKNMITSLNPFQIPQNLMEEYLDEFIRVAKDEGHLSDSLTITYSTNTLYAKKY